jgi:hypothetical protein
LPSNICATCVLKANLIGLRGFPFNVYLRTSSTYSAVVPISVAYLAGSGLFLVYLKSEFLLADLDPDLDLALDMDSYPKLLTKIR